MKFVQFNGAIFETSNLVIYKSDSDGNYEIIIVNKTRCATERYDTEEARDDVFDYYAELLCPDQNPYANSA